MDINVRLIIAGNLFFGVSYTLHIMNSCLKEHFTLLGITFVQKWLKIFIDGLRSAFRLSRKNKTKVLTTADQNCENVAKKNS